MSIFDYLTVAFGVFCFIVGIAQLIKKKCIGIYTIDQYTEESARKLAPVLGATNVLCGLAMAITPFIINDISYVIIFILLAIELGAQFSILKKKN